MNNIISSIENLVMAARMEAYVVTDMQSDLNERERRLFERGYIAAKMAAIEAAQPAEYALWRAWDEDQLALEIEKEQRKASQNWDQNCAESKSC